MRHIIFQDAPSHRVALLMKPGAFNKKDLTQHYLEAWRKLGIPHHDVIGFTLDTDGKKVSAKFAKEYLAELMPLLKEQGVEYLYVPDSTYFKLVTGVSKSEPHLGYVLPCKLKGFEHMHVVLGLNYQQLIYNPELGSKLQQTIEALASHASGTYQAPGTGIIHKAVYPKTYDDIKAALEALKAYPEITMDIEAFSLKFWEAGIGTISIAVDEHNGVAFACDYMTVEDWAKIPRENPCQEILLTSGTQVPNYPVRALIKDFLTTYTGNITWHNAGYDVKVIIYTLWMNDLLDQKGLLEGLEVLTRSIDDTKLIAYLATNTTAGNVLGLKSLAQEFAGNWAKDDITDIRRIPLPDLLQYNLVDSLSTWYVKKKFTPIMIRDQQLPLYQDLFLPSQKLILQMELTGMPMSRKRIVEVKAKLIEIQNDKLDIIVNNSTIKAMNLLVQERAWTKDHDTRLAKSKTGKIKQKTQADFEDLQFNPNSGPQLQVLLYELMGLPVIDYTDTKLPATGADTIEKLIHHTNEPAYKEVLKALIEYGQVTKILNTFIPAFEGAISKDGSDTVWLHGSINLGGTVSGRLSSSEPNLQNLPAGNSDNKLKAFLGKLVKYCFVGPNGFVFFGADFNSLEDYISALTSKDPAKLDVYIKGFDGHCLRAAYYFRDQLLHIDLTDPMSVNTIKKTHPELRQESKAPTFALTYQGTWRTLVTNLGWSEVKSRGIETNYHLLYKVSDDYIYNRLVQASKDGYATVAFGLRVRTPLLAQVVFGAPRMPSEAAAEGRTVGNAMGQSYGLLNNRAAVAFWKKVWASEFKYDILPSALIHDAIYGVVRENPAAVEFVNNALITEMQWQELPEIQHPTVKLGANLDLYWPDWGHPITFPNFVSQGDILKLCQEARQEILNPKP